MIEKPFHTKLLVGKSFLRSMSSWIFLTLSNRMKKQFFDRRVLLNSRKCLTQRLLQEQELTGEGDIGWKKSYGLSIVYIDSSLYKHYISRLAMTVLLFLFSLVKERVHVKTRSLKTAVLSYTRYFLGV